MSIGNFGIISPLKVLKSIIQPWAVKPLSIHIKAIYDPTGPGDNKMVKAIENYFDVKFSRTMEEFLTTEGLDFILNLYSNDKVLVPGNIPVIEGFAAEIIWEYITRIEELSIQREIFYQALNSAIEGIQIADAQGTEIFVNDAFLKITKLKPEDRLGKSVFEVSPDGGLAWVLQNKSAVKHIRNHPKGTNVELLSNAAPIIINGNFYGAVSVMQDITDLIQLSKELEKSKGIVDYLNKKVGHLATAKYFFKDIIGCSSKIKEIVNIAQKVANGNQAILIQGESGTGKEIFAHAIHNASNRRFNPFIAVNCAAIPEQLLESEFFGHEKGAFTGANTRKLGMFELAHTGTLFLDEIGDMNLSLQSKLLRVLQEREFLRVGGITPIKVDVRIIAATNRNLLQLVQEGKFREDLFYRLNVINLVIPPLRERLEDLPLLAEHFINKINKRLGKSIRGVSKDAIKVLREYKWPGNVRELENVFERAILLCQGDIIQAWDLCLPGTHTVKNPPAEDDEKEKIKFYLLKYGCSVAGKKEVARQLKMSLATLYNKIKQYQLEDFYIRNPKL